MSTDHNEKYFFAYSNQRRYQTLVITKRKWWLKVSTERNITIKMQYSYKWDKLLYLQKVVNRGIYHTEKQNKHFNFN